MDELAGPGADEAAGFVESSRSSKCSCGWVSAWADEAGAASMLRLLAGCADGREGMAITIVEEGSET